MITLDPKAIDTFDADDPIRALYKRAIDKSMGGKPDNPVKQMRYYVMHQLAEHAMLQNPNEDIAEFGCWRGHSTLILANLMQQHRHPTDGARFHVFDSFEGLSPFGPNDKSKERKAEDMDPRKYATPMSKLADLLSVLSFVELHKGWIPEVFMDLPDSIGDPDKSVLAFANIDVNLYEPTRDSLAFAYARMPRGGVIFFDDYGYKTCPGATMAIDEFIADHDHAMFVALPFGSAFLVR